MRGLFRPRTIEWFESALGQPTRAQAEAWPAIAAGRHTLVSAPTGAGKTLAAFLALIDQMKARAEANELKDELEGIYISPLKSLAADVRENLTRPLLGVGGPEIRTAMRTGDTPARDRQRMLDRPPHILITTPESLYLLLTTQRGREMLRTVKWAIVDELHAVISTKRGAHLALSLARLDALCERPVQRIGLSATIQPLDLAADFLAPGKDVAVVAPPMEKRADLAVRGPVEDMRILPQGSVWPEIARRVVEECRGRRAVIAFVEGRAQAERLAKEVNEIAGPLFAMAHHGSVSREKRQEAEEALRSGTLRLLCATSSMELGIDVGEVDLVIQVGCPLTVSAALQRMGRAGHSPGRVSVMRVYPKTAADALLCGLTAQVAREGGIEPARPPRECLDVLAQHLTSMAAEGGYTVDEALAVARAAWPTRSLARSDIEEVLKMLAGDWEHAHDRPARPRVVYDRIHGTVSGDGYTRLLALSAGGVIPDRGLYPAYTREGMRVGELDEEFVFEARVGDRFLLGAFAWRLEEVRRDRVIVSSASPAGAQAPFWRGDGTGRDYGVSLRFGQLLRGLPQGGTAAEMEAALEAFSMDQAAARNAARYARDQVKAAGCLPDDRTIWVEHFTGESGESQMMAHSIFGRRVNYALAMLLQRAAQEKMGCDVKAYEDDNGVLLYAMGTRDFPFGLVESLDAEGAAELVSAMLPGTPLFFMNFRYNAGRALLMGARSGRRQALWVQRVRGAEALGDAAGDMSHPMMRETMRECLEDYLDMNALKKILSDIRAGLIRVREARVDRPSPMALPARRQAEADLMYDYSPIPAAARRASEEAADRIARGLAPDRQALEAQAERKRPDSPERLHSLMMAEGDFVAGEVDAPIEWLEELAAQGRCLYIEPGLWIAAEQAEDYRRALEGADPAARMNLARRCLRYRGPQDGESLAQRYGWDEGGAEAALKALAESGAAVKWEEMYCHAQVYARAQRETLAARRQAIKTLPPERYAALLARSLRRPGPAAEQVKEAIESLSGRAFPVKMWEGQLLPARVNGYRPRMLDSFIAQGEYFWQAGPEDGKLAFYPAEDTDWDAPPLYRDAEGLDEGENILLAALERRGASFASALSPLVKGDVADLLLDLAERGLVRADSFVPLRTLTTVRENPNLPARQLARAKSAAMAAGRWELARPRKARTEEELLREDFREKRILCRETVSRLPWSRAVEILRVWEYTALARRGYFVEGLSGIQFVAAEDYAAVTAGLTSREDEPIWLHANDPAQAWGNILPHREGRSFLCVPGTAVCLIGGQVAAVLERGGESLRLFMPDRARPALLALAREFHQGCLFPARDRVAVKRGADGLDDALDSAGFARDALDWVMWKDR